MTKSTKTAPKTTEESAIVVQAPSPAPIAAAASSQWQAFAARPGIAATVSALIASGNGFKRIWNEEKQYEYGKSFIVWGFGVAKAIALPILSLFWLALNSAYIWIRKPETKTAISAKWHSLKDWAAPKFGYERSVDCQTELKL